MRISSKELKRFHLEGKLGEGADSEAFAATDADTGTPVVVKRPHPTLITRAQHNAVERRIARVISLRERLGDKLPHIAKMLAYTPRAAHDEYFGDALGEQYTVVVEERAHGIPLVGSAIDGIKRHPIGIPQNIFAVHPVVPHAKRGRFSVARDVLEVAETFHNGGALILDMRPQNIYFAPANAKITVIDIGGIAEERRADRRKPPLDPHDFYLELFKWYIPHSRPPTDAAEYRRPLGMESVPMFNQNLDAMIRRHTEDPCEPYDTSALDILRNIKARAYPTIQAFKQDFTPFLTLLEARYARLSECARLTQAWHDALNLLTDDYWRKFQFNPGDLTSYPVQEC